jgi:dienelactone hydrolase
MHLRSRLPALLTLAFAAILPHTAFAAAAAAPAEINSAVHEYKIGDAAYEGYIARPANLAKDAVVPAVLVVHDWTGNGEFSQGKADYLAKLGYIAFAVDMYGKGIRAPQAGEPAALAGVLYQNPALFRERITAALEDLKKQPGVDASRIGAIGFCFGGTTVLELARSGADVKGVVSFHGGLKPFTATAKDAVKARVSILHGVRDPLVTPEDLAACMADLNDAGAWFQLVGFPNAVHAFTNPKAGNDPSKGVAYDAAADKGAFATMEVFFRGLFATKKPAN